MKLRRTVLFALVAASLFGVSQSIRFGDVIRANSEKCTQMSGKVVKLKSGKQICLPSEMPVESLITCDEMIGLQSYKENNKNI